MRLENLTKVWVASRLTTTEYGVEVGGYTGLRDCIVNIQTEHSQLDIQEFGEIVNEIVHLRSTAVPDIGKGDMVYLSEPAPVDTFEVDGVTYIDYGDGDYKVLSIHSGYHNRPTRNPTRINARMVTK